MKIPFIRTTTDQADTLMLVVHNEPHVLDSGHPRFNEICALAEQKVKREDLPQREAELQELIDFASIAFNTMRSLSERVTIKGETIYFDGDVIENPISDHIVAMIKSGDDTWQAPVNFLENVQANPAKHVRKGLYEWISSRALTLTAEGHVIGYKGVQDTEDNLSITQGSNTVYVDDAEHTGHIPNPIGATVSTARSAVDDDRSTECSYGLHVGTHDYASKFARNSRGKLLTVSFNPRDVVAIPKGEGHAKIRTCRYKVLEVAAPEPYQGTTYISNDAQDADAEDVTLCVGCGEETEDGEPQCDECLAAEDDDLL